MRYQRLNRKSTGQTSIKHPQLYHERLNPNGYPSPPAHPAPMSSLFSTSKPRTGPSHWGNGPWGVRKSEGITGENWTYNHGSYSLLFLPKLACGPSGARIGGRGCASGMGINASVCCRGRSTYPTWNQRELIDHEPWGIDLGRTSDAPTSSQISLFAGPQHHGSH